MIDAELQAKLRARFNPEGSDLRKLQLRLLEILKFIDGICTANNIHYWLSSGTCIGAVRHGGFIPWDDDVDIEMFEDDYNRFCKIMSTQNNPDYVLQTHKTDKNYLLSFGKVRDTHSIIYEDLDYDTKYKYRGCFVDVFPIAPSNSKRLFSLGQHFNIFLVEADHYNNMAKRSFWLNANRIVLPLIRLFSRIGANGVYRHSIGSLFPKRRYYKDIKETVKLKFEGCEFPVPVNYDSYLTSLYGDYIKIPSPESIHIHTSKFELY